VEVVDHKDNVLATLNEGNVFGEIGLLLSQPRTATVRAKTHCALFELDRDEFARVLQDQPHFAQSVMEVAQQRYNVTVGPDTLMRKA